MMIGTAELAQKMREVGYRVVLLPILISLPIMAFVAYNYGPVEGPVDAPASVEVSVAEEGPRRGRIIAWWSAIRNPVRWRSQVETRWRSTNCSTT